MTLNKRIIHTLAGAIIIPRVTVFHAVSRKKPWHYPKFRNYSDCTQTPPAIETGSHDRKQLLSELSQCASVTKIFEFFYTNRGKLTNDDLLAVLYQLAVNTTNPIKRDFPCLNDIWKDPDIGDFSKIGYLNYKNNELIKYVKEISDIYLDIKFKINSFTIKQLLFLVRVTNCLNLPHAREIRNHAATVISNQIWILDLKDLVRAGYVFLNNTRFFSKRFEDFPKIFLHASLKNFKDTFLIENSDNFHLFKILSTSSTVAPSFLQEISQYVFSNISSLSTSTLVYTLTRYSQYCFKDDPIIVQHIIELLNRDITDLTTPEICDIVWSAAKLYSRRNKPEPCFDILKRLRDKVQKIAPEVSINRLAMLVWSYSTTEYDEELMKTFLECSLKSLDKFEATALSNALYGFSTTIPTLSYELFDKADEHIIKNIKSFNTVDLATTALAYCNVRSGTSMLYNVMSEAILEVGSLISSDCLSKILYTFATMNCCQDAVHGLILSVIERLEQFTTHGLVIALWSFSAFKIFTVSLWKSILPLIDASLIEADYKYELLYPALLEFKQENPDAMEKLVDRLLNLSKPTYLEMQLNQSQSLDKEFADKVYESLVDHYSLNENTIARNHVVDNILIDIIFVLNDTPYGVFLYDDSNVSRLYRQPLGQYIQRDRLANGLSLQGNQVKIIRLLKDEAQQNIIESIQEHME